MKTNEKIVKKMVSIFKKMDTDEFINAFELCQLAVESLGMAFKHDEYLDCWYFYDEFHSERRKQKIRIKGEKHCGEIVGIPPFCDHFARQGKQTKQQKAYKKALTDYKRKFKELPNLNNGAVYDAMLKSRKELTKIINRAVKRGTKVRERNLYGGAWIKTEPKYEQKPTFTELDKEKI